MVLRSIPVTRSIWRWLVLVASSVVIVVCRCGFKTFNPVSLVNEGVKVTSCLVLNEPGKKPDLTGHHTVLRVGEFEVATSGGIWVAIRAFVAATASRPSGEGNRRYAKLPSLERSHSRRRSPVSSCPTRRRLRALVVVAASGHQSGASRWVSGQWPAASHVVCAPPTLWPRRCAALALRWVPVRPQGAPSAQRPIPQGARRKIQQALRACVAHAQRRLHHANA